MPRLLAHAGGTALPHLGLLGLFLVDTLVQDLGVLVLAAASVAEVVYASADHDLRQHPWMPLRGGA